MRSVELEADLLLGGQRLHGARDLLDDVGHRHYLQAKLHLARFDLREIEDVVAQAGPPSRPAGPVPEIGSTMTVRSTESIETRLTPSFSRGKSSSTSSS